MTNLWLDKSSVSNGESNSKGNNTGNKSGTVSNHNTLIDISGLGSERSHGSGEGSNGGSVVVLEGGGLALLGEGSQRLGSGAGSL
mmetsp:Transcript_701/g.2742  ORF Transcript_701/g.2742 Transcript_701/m.2742 type:complete len:85 (+) Transcript_701:204-458(+)